MYLFLIGHSRRKFPKRVEVVNLDKRQTTVLLSCTLTGKLLPTKIKDVSMFAKRAGPEGWYLCYTENHWSRDHDGLISCLVLHRYLDQFLEKPYIGYIFVYQYRTGTVMEKVADTDLFQNTCSRAPNDFYKCITMFVITASHPLQGQRAIYLTLGFAST